jgi:hypothetical protein
VLAGSVRKMTILPSTAGLLSRQVRLLVNPPTTTLFDSRAILSELQSRFGPVSTFLSQRNDPVLKMLLQDPQKPLPVEVNAQSQTILTVFDSSASKTSAIASSPLKISCGGDLLPSADELDPYNVRGLRGRHHPPKRHFTCHVLDDGDPEIHRLLTAGHPYSGPFRLDIIQVSYADLVKNGGVDSHETADIMQTKRTVIEDGRRQGKPAMPHRELHSETARHEDPQLRGGLMGAWRRGTAARETGHKTEP